MVTFATPKATNSAMQVLDPENQISYCDPENENPIQIFNENIKQFVKTIPSDCKNVPMVTICVLGTDDANTAKFLTNWLIYYYKNGKPKTYSRNIEKGLEYVGDSKVRKNKNGQGHGLYLWPEAELHDGQLYLVLYANCQQFESINMMCALASSAIITLKPSQKEQIVTYLKLASSDNAVPKDTKFIDASSCCLRISVYRNGGGSGIQQAWTTLFDAIENEQLQPKEFHGSMVNPRTFEKFMQEIAVNLNSKQLEHQNLYLTKESEENAIRAVRTSKVRVPDSAQEYTPVVPHPVVRQTSRNIEKSTKTADVEICNTIYSTLEDWVNHYLDPSTVDKILDILQSKEVKRAGPLLKSDILGLHSVIKRFNEDLYKMHDNYVCFHGTRDKDQNTWLQNSACETALTNFKSASSADQHCTRIFEAAKARLLDIYQNDNKFIEDVEIGLANRVANYITHEYREILKNYSNLQNLAEEEFQQIHQRMIEHSVSILGKSMSYGGRLNNVVRESSKLVTKHLNKTFIRACEKMNVDPTSPAPSLPPCTNTSPIADPLFSYDQLIRETLTKHNGSISKEFHQEHKQIIRQVLGSTTGSEREELKVRLRTHLGYLDELHEQVQEEPNTKDNPSTVAMFITSHWIWLAVNGKLLKYQLLNYTNDNGISTPGFPAEIAWLNNQLVYGHSVKKIQDTVYQNRIINFICDKSISRETARRMVTEFFKRIKFEVDDMAKENISRLFLIMPNWLDVNGRNFLRDCGWAAGFQKTMILTEPSVSAFYTIFKFPNLKKPCILVVCLDGDAIRLEIFRHENVGVHLLAVACEIWLGVKENRNSKRKINLEVLHATYGRVLGQIPAKERKLVTHYILLSETTKWANDLDKYFQTKAGLIKADNIDKGETFLEVFSHFNSNSQKIIKFVSSLATLPTNSGNIPEKHGVVCESGQISEESKALLKKCESIERQLEAGVVPVSNLTKKIILQAIRKGKSAVQQNIANGPEAAHVNEIFEKYNFKKN